MAETPRATYRLQLRNGVGFAQAKDLVPYLARLGISHLYLAPAFKAPGRLDPRLRRGRRDRARPDARRHGGLRGPGPQPAGARPRADPRHRPEPHGDRPRQSLVVGRPGARPVKPLRRLLRHRLRSRPGRQAGPAHAGIPARRDPEQGRAEAEARRGQGGLVLAYYDTPYPLAPGSAKGLDPERVDEGRCGACSTPRPTAWPSGARASGATTAASSTSASLAGLRIEDPEVFEATHALIFDLVERGLVQGLRIDHVDGLRRSKGLPRPAARRRAHTRSDQPFYVVVEKILVGDERLPADWPVAGTTGYEFANQVLGPAGRPGRRRPRSASACDRVHRRARSLPRTCVDEAKRLVLAELFAGRAQRHCCRQGCAHAARPRPDEPRRARPAPSSSPRFPVYRTYGGATSRGAPPTAPIAGAAVAAARRRGPTSRPSRRLPATACRRWSRATEAAERRGLVTALPAAHRPGHGQGRRGHRLLPLQPPARPQRGRRRARRARRRAGRVPRG